MSKVGSWSTTPGNNNSTPPDGWPEGQAPSTVNDCGREMMASIRTLISDGGFIDLNNTPSYLTATSFSLGASDTTNWEIGRRVKLFDATTLYGTIISVSATFVQVRLDSGALTSSLSSAALSVLHNSASGLPDGAFDQQNVVFNGAMELWQRTASIDNVVTGQYGPDRFCYFGVNSASLNLYRIERSAAAANVPTISSAGPRLNCSARLYVSAIDAVIAAGDFAVLMYRVEGTDWRQIAHRPMGLSFQCRTNCSGVYAVSLRSGLASTSYVQNFTISAINTWQRFFVPIEAASTAFTWDYSGGVGLSIAWTFAAGTTYRSSSGQWSAMNALATGSQVNFLATAGNTFDITDVRFKSGAADTPTSFRSWDAEVNHCQRYFEKGQDTVYGYVSGAGQENRHTVPFKVTKRIPPSISVTTAVTVLNLTTVTPVNASTGNFDLSLVGTAAGPIINDVAAWTADAEF